MRGLLRKPEPAIRRRTDEERKAYVAGFTTCLELVDRNGPESARDQLALMAVTEGMVTQEEADDAKTERSKA